ncbi:GNAT family N-acetyltransferase [Streptomyces sp. NPDC085946]|uniref:GNAT family N-acetyltransferase n=1 Tax=Streptomyces sp. NPDC085946 TaxID=3365744 RepID=UPI0037CDEAF3
MDGKAFRRHTFVATGPDGGLTGFVTVSRSPWNRRLTIEDVEVAPGHRRRGVGRALMGQAVEFAREHGAGHLWLEVSDINAPAIHAYRRMGSPGAVRTSRSTRTRPQRGNRPSA